MGGVGCKQRSWWLSGLTIDLIGMRRRSGVEEDEEVRRVKREGSW